METKSAWEKYTDAQMAQLTELADAYKAFISQNKTERECVSAAVDEARAAGYISLDEARAQANAGMPLAAGAKVYATQHGKACMLVHVGATPLTAGANILGAHIDSPRLDVKQNPLYEKDGFTLLDTHYYGGIKKYQWVTLPLAIHGVVAKTDGTVVPVSIGEAASDPVFCVTDLLPHLGSAQMEKNAAKVIDGEDLDLLVGNRFAPAPAQNAEGVTSDTFENATPDATKEKVRAFTMGLLEEKYGITEADFLSAELEIVPAGPARDCGFDRSMVIGYGQDDRVCAYTSLAAQLELARTGKTPAKTAVCILVDKEEIGSVGATGMESAFFENTMAEVLELAGVTSATALRRALAASRMLSSDVSAGVDPAYSSVFESKNAAYLGHGLVFNKYTGARGKSGSNDARAEYIASLRAIMEGAGVTFQTAELGRVDAGGGGTIAYIPARFGMDVIDSGVAVLSMHSPWEVTSKADIYEAYRGYIAFLESE